MGPELSPVFSVQSVFNSDDREFDVYQRTELLNDTVDRQFNTIFNQYAGESIISGFGTPKNVLIKPNWVNHKNEGGHGLQCLITQKELLLALLEKVVSLKPERVIIGDAPIQGCEWDSILSPDFVNKAKDICRKMTLEIVDFRKSILGENSLASGGRENKRENKFVLFDLSADSLLDPISSRNGIFRVTMYDPRKLAETHHKGMHKYSICREAFEVDLIINCPKLKTHRKAGLTGALKNLVGLNHNKDYLPHHRVGGSALGGDCYSGWSPIKRTAEFCLDRANRNIGSARYHSWLRLEHFLTRVQQKIGDTNLEGGWYGNDTLWRMALDLNRILIYGRIDGSMADTPQRRIWSFTDAIVCGQGNGPLAPEPLWLGAVTFSNSSPHADYLHALLIGLDPNKIPIINHAFDHFRWPLNVYDGPCRIYMDGKETSFEHFFNSVHIQCKPPTGWIDHCELVSKNFSISEGRISKF